MIAQTATVGLTETTATVAEGSNHTFTVELSAAISSTVTLLVSTEAGTATAGDYTALSDHEVEIAAGQTSTTFTVETTADDTVEDDETFTVALSQPSTGLPAGVSAGTFTATVTITDDDDATVDIADQEVDEDGGAQAITVTLSNPVSKTVAVQVSTTDGTAVAPGDYGALTNHPVTFTAGDTEKNFTVTPVDDDEVDGDKNFTVTLSAVGTLPDEVTLAADPTATITIADSEVSPATLGLTEQTVSTKEGSDHTFTVSLSRAVDEVVTVEVSTMDGTADFDYTPLKDHQLRFQPGETTKKFMVSMYKDFRDEVDETFTVMLSVIGTLPEDVVLGTTTTTVTIEDVATLGFQSVPTIYEGTSKEVSVNLSKAVDEVVTVEVSTEDGTATAGDDYTALTTHQLVFAVGEMEATFTLETLDDDVFEGIESFRFKLSVVGMLPDDVILHKSTINVSLFDDEREGSGSIDLTGERTGNEGASIIFKVRFVTDGLPSAVTVEVSTADGTATAGDDYTALTEQLTFEPDGETEATFTLETLDDEVVEGNETFTVHISAVGTFPDGVRLETPHRFTIYDDDDATVDLPATATLSEDGGEQDITVTMTKEAGKAITAQVSTTDGTATVGNDYTALTNHELTFEPGETEATLTLETLADNEVEGDETFTARLVLTGSPPTGISLGTDVMTVTIADGDIARVGLTETTVEVDEGAGHTFTVQLDQAVSSTFTLLVSTADGTATAGDDYTALTNHRLVFALGDLSKTFTVNTTAAEGTVEEDQTFTVTLTGTLPNDVGFSPGAATATVTILDEDTARVGLASGTTTVDEDGGAQAITVEISRAATEAVNLQVSTADGTATAGDDYTALTNQAVTIPTGQTSATFDVTPVDDMVAEGLEAFTVELSAVGTLPSGVALGRTTLATITITDDEVAPTEITLSVDTDDATTGAQTSVDEGVTDQTITVTASFPDGSATFPAATTVSVTVGGTGSTATGGGMDFDNVDAFTLTIAAGQTSGTETFDLTTTDDDIVEGDETIRVAGTVTDFTVSHADITITDGDAATVDIADQTVTEDDGAQAITVTLSKEATSDVALQVSTTAGTATSGTDYTALSNQAVTITAGQKSATFNVTPTADEVVEGNETFTVTLTAASTLPAGVTLGDATATITITDGDAATVDIADHTVTEDGSAQAITVTLSKAATSDVALQVSTTAGTATSGTDYTALSNQAVTITAGQKSATFNVTPTADDLVEGSENFTVTLTAASTLPAGVTLGDATATITITDGDAATVDIADQTVTEDGGAQAITVTLSKEATSDVALQVSTTAGTATSGTDYTALSNQAVTITAGQKSATFDVTPAADDVVEGDETFTVTVAASGTLPAGVTLGDATATITITDGDAATVDIADQTVTEDGGAQAITVTLSKEATSDVALQVSTSAGTATSGTDYTALSNQAVTITAGQKSATFNVTPTADEVVEGNETFTVTLTAASTLPAGVTLGDATATITITDGDAATVDIADQTVTEDGGAQAITVTLSKAATSAVALQVTTTTGTATSGTDYTALSNQAVTITAGQKSATFNVTPTADDLVEGSENFTVTLTAASTLPAGVTLGDATATITITDGDAATVDIADQTVTEDDGAQAITVTLSKAATTDVALQVSTSAGTATAGDDYTALTNQAVTITAGQKSATFNVTPAADDLVEGSETFTVTLTAASTLPAGVTLGDATATITITDNDTATLTLTPATQSVDEGRDASFTVTLSHAVKSAVSVTWSVTPGTATAPDYTLPQTQSVTFAAGSATDATQTFSVSTVDDALAEGSEDFSVALGTVTSTLSSLVTANTTAVSATINDNDAEPTAITLSVNPTSVSESDGVTEVTVTAAFPQGSPALTTQTDVSVSVSGNTASGGGVDFNDVTAFTVSILAGQTSGTATFDLSPVSDAIVEDDETISVSGTLQDFTITAATITITDDDRATLTLTGPSAAVAEGSAAGFTVTLSHQVNAAVSVAWTLSHTDTEAADFTGATTGSVTFPANSAVGATQTFSVSPLDDVLSEGAEDFSVALGTVTSTLSSLVTATTTAVRATLAPSDAITVSVAGPTRVAEGAAAEYTVSLSPAGVTPTADLTVDYATADGTATAGNDYTAASGTLTFTQASAQAQKVAVQTAQDAVAEGDEDFTFTLSGASGGGGPAPTLGDASVSTTITDDDPAPTTIALRVDPTNAAEGATTAITVLAKFPDGSASLAENTDVTVSVGPGTAVEGTDFTAVADFTVTIAAGQTIGTADFNLTVADDNEVEGGETVTVTGTASGFAVSGTAVAINDGDSPPTSIALSVRPTSASEGATTAITVTAKFPDGSPALPSATAVTVSVGGGTATGGGVDFDDVADFTVTILAGQPSGEATFDLTTTDDSIVEGTETIRVSGTAQGFTVSHADLTITDGDAAPTGITLTLNPTNVAENGTAQTVQVTAALTGGTTRSEATTVTVSVGDGTATAPADYAAVADFEIIIPAETASATGSFSITPVDDTLDEPNETVAVTGTTVVGLAVTGADLTITDGDPPDLPPGPNHAPVAADDAATTEEETAVTVNVLANDTDVDGDPLSVQSATAPAHGTATVTDAAAGMTTYMPEADFTGEDRFTYTVSDGKGGTAAATVTVTVTSASDPPEADPPVNKGPVARVDVATTEEDVSVTIPVLANDTDADGDPLTVQSATAPAHGTARINPNGTITYTPHTNFNGEDRFNYTISDSVSGTSYTVVILTVTPVNDAPGARVDVATTKEETPVTLDVLANDTDVEGDPLTVQSATDPAHGTAQVNPHGTITYTPHPNFNGEDRFNYTISDGAGGTAYTVVILTVTPVNDAPGARVDAATTEEETPVTIPVLANDTDVEGDPLTVQSATAPAHGTAQVNPNGTITYTPHPNFNGEDRFNYTISDGAGGTAYTVVILTVTPVNDAPGAADDAATTKEETTVTVNVLANDTDVEGDPLTVQSATAPAHGTAGVNPNGTITYTPHPNFNGEDRFTYTISDGAGGTDAATVVIEVTPVNDAPVAGHEGAITDEETPVTLDVLANDTDVDGDVLRVSSVTRPARGTAAVADDGTITYTPETNATGAHTFTYTVSDGMGGTDKATVVIGVTPVNDVPVAADDAATTDEETPVTLDVLANDTDVDSDPLTVQSMTDPAHGTVKINAAGTITYTPHTDFNGADTFTYTVADGQGGTDKATVTIMVTPVNDAPVARVDVATTDEETPVTLDVLANDTDADGDALRVTGVLQPDNGAATHNAAGTITYTPPTDFNGADTFTYTISDGVGGTATASVILTVTPVNDASVAAADAATTDEETAVTVHVLANDTDVDGDALTVDDVTSPSHGTVIVNAAGTITYTPPTDFNGVDRFTYTVADGVGGTAEASVIITITPVNDLPVAADDAATTDEETAVTVEVLANDTDADGDPLTVQSMTNPSHGTLTHNGDGTITYTPHTDFNGVDTFTYTVADGAGGTATASVILTVTPVNDAPVAADDAATTKEETAVTVEVLANDTDADGDPLTVDDVTSPSHGTVIVNADGTITYTPHTDFNGADTFTYTVADGQAGTDEATVTITVSPVNDLPVAADDAATTDEETAVTVEVLANDTDVDGDALTVDDVTSPSHGTVIVNADGTITYTPPTDFNGVDRFTYTVADGAGGTAEASVTVTVSPVNDLPVAADDAATTDEETAVTVHVLANDTDVDGDALTVDDVTSPAHGTGIVNAAGTITYTPPTDFNGVDRFTYTVADGAGGTAEASVTVTVSPVNDLPVAAADAATTDEETAVIVAVLANDTDVDGDPLTVDDVTSPAHGTGIVNAAGTITYTPPTDFNGVDRFTYTVADGAGGTAEASVTVTVSPVNDLPVAAADAATTDEETAVTVEVLANDTDADGDPLTVDDVTSPSHGTVIVNADGTITYTPHTDFNGADTFTYIVSDGHDGTDEATVSITVTPVNDASVAAADAATTDEETTVTIDVLANDTDADGDPLTVDDVTSPAHGTVIVNAAGTITYTPASNFNGADTFTYTISDGHDGTDEATVSITVTPVNDLPVAANDAATTDEEMPATLDVLANDTDVDSDPLTISGVTPPAHGTAAVADEGTITYTPETDFNGEDRFTYTVSDGAGGIAEASVTITVTPINDLPVAADDVATTDEETAVTVEVLANDTDVDGDPLTVDGMTPPTHGTATHNGDDTITYTPETDFNGEDRFTYTVSDGAGGIAEASVSITVSPVNDLPVAAADAATTDEEMPATINVLANDADADGDPLTVDDVTPPAHGTATVADDGAIIYIPETDFNGADRFTYTVSDGAGGIAEASVSITVSPVNDLPVAADDAATTDEETAVTVEVLTNDTDVDGDPLTVDGMTPPTHGTATHNGDDTITYTPETDFNGEDRFTYTVSDGQGGIAEASVIITVTPVNDLPVAADDAATTDEETAVTVEVLANDADADGDPLTVDDATPPAHGTATHNGDDTITYTPETDFNGEDRFTYTVSDGAGGIAEASVSITVSPVNDLPVAADDAATTDEEAATTLDVLANDADADGDPLTLSAVTPPAHGTATVADDGAIIYTPETHFNGADRFTYTVADGAGGIAEASVSITVSPVNDLPVAADDAATTDEETAVTVNVLANDTDADGDPLTVAAVTPPAHGTATVADDGAIIYTPETHFNGADRFTYTVADGQGGIAEASVSITVTPVNDAPVAVDDAATTKEETDVTVEVLTNDTDVDGDALTVADVTSPSHGTATVADAGTITYTPETHFNGADRFTYTVADGQGGIAEASVIITVTPVNDLPVAADDGATTKEEMPATLDVLANDTDVDGDPLTVSDVTPPAHGTATVADAGTITYTPETDFNGEDRFTYTVADGQGGTAEASVSITVTAVNDLPVAADDAATTDEETAVTVEVLANDTDADGDALTISAVTTPAHGTAAVADDGTITYTPETHFNGEDTFTYTVADGQGGTAEASVSITVTAVNDLPVAADDAATTDEETATTLDVLANDTDVDGDPLTISGVTPPAHGTATVADDGTITYTPETHFNGEDRFTYTVADGQGGTATALVSITVTAVNDAPVAADDAATTKEETAVTVNVLANDTDADGDPLTVDDVTPPAHGTAAVADDGTIIYTPETDFNGADRFTYTVSDGAGGIAEASVSITVSPVNDLPVAAADAATTDEEAAVTVNVLANDTDADGDPLTVDDVTSPSHGTATVADAGTITYTPETHFNGEDRFTYTVSDGAGGIAEASVSITVTPVNDAPVATDDAATTDEETAVTVEVLANDTDADGDPLTVADVTPPAHGTAAVADDGTIIYTPETDFNGEDRFTYTVSDGAGGTAEASVSITVTAVNDAPVAADDAATTDEETTVTIDVLANDTDADGDPLTVQSMTDPSHGTLTDNGDGTITYTPETDFNGTDAFTYTVSDSEGSTAEASVSITVTPVNDAPVAVGTIPAQQLEVKAAAAIEDLAAYFRDPDGDALRYTAVSSAPAVVAAHIDGHRLTLAPQAIGEAAVTVTAVDAEGAAAMQQVTVTVAASSADRQRIIEQTLSTFGYMVATETVEVLGRRFGASGGGRSHVRLGGQSLAYDGRTLLRGASGLLGMRLAHPFAAGGSIWDRPADSRAQRTARPRPMEQGLDPENWLRLHPISARTLMSQTSFQVSPGAGADEPGPSAWTIWGQGNVSGLRSRPEDDFSLDSDVGSAYLGTDYRLDRGPLLGLLLSHSRGAIDYTSPINGKGAMATHLTSVYPYSHWTPRPGLGVWGLFGLGWGRAEWDEAGAPFETGIGLGMAALGGREHVASWDRVDVAVKADAFAVQMQSGRADDVRAQRVRLATEGSMSGWSVRPSVEVGVRLDAGEAIAGAGAEVGAGLGYRNAGLGLNVDARGRTLVVHQADALRQWGANLSVRREPGGTRGGWSFALAPEWGRAASGVEGLWRDGGLRIRPAAVASEPGWTPNRVRLEMGYGLVLLQGRGRLTPFGGWGLEGASSQRMNVGVRLAIVGPGMRLRLDLSGEQRPVRRVGLVGSAGF